MSVAAGSGKVSVSARAAQRVLLKKRNTHREGKRRADESGKAHIVHRCGYLPVMRIAVKRRRGS
jgi:hypothetical protein